MPWMRDKQTRVERWVSDSYLKRWPDDYEPIKRATGRNKPVTQETESSGGSTKKESSND